MITETDLGWLAGIFDFQAHITRKNNKMRAQGSVQLVLYVETAKTPIIQKLCELTGVSVEMHHNQSDLKAEWNRKGCIEHCPDPHVHVPPSLVTMPPMARWTVTGAALAVVLWNVRPLMISDHEEWDWALAMTLGGARLSGQGSGAVLRALRRLQGLGWELPPVFGEVPPVLEVHQGWKEDLDIPRFGADEDVS